MNNEEAIANLVGLMTSFHLEIRALPDDLKCAKCKSVLKNACQMPCGCRFCRACIDDVISRRHQLCPGGSQECGATPLSTAQRDYTANKSVFNQIAKCPHAGCPCECPLADMNGHMRVCPRKHIDCPFRELGCVQDALPGEEMSGHLLQESRGHSEILIRMVTHITRDMDMLKRELLLKDEQGKHFENEMKLIKDENKSIKNENKSMKKEMKSIKDENKSMKEEMKSIKDENKSIKNENKTINDVNKSINIDIKSVKDENKSVKDENKSMKVEMKSIKIENESIKNENKAINDVNKSINIDIKSVKDENKSIKDEIKFMEIENESIQREKEVLCDRVRQLSEKLEREIGKRLQSKKRYNAMVTGTIASIRDETRPVRGDIQSIRDQFDQMKCQVELIQIAAGLGQHDDWLIEEDMFKTAWGGLFNDNVSKTSGKFGLAHAFEMESVNSVSRGVLRIYLRIWAGPSDPLLQWPFRGVVTVTVADRDRRDACSRQTLQCEIERPENNDYSLSDKLVFRHAALMAAGINLERGVSISCRIVPVRASDAVSPSVTMSLVSSS